MDIEQISQIATALSLIFIAISAIVAWFLFCNQQKLNRANTHLKLREMFCEKNRFIVHSNLRPGGIWANGDGPVIQTEWIIVEDYLGLFEVCEQLLKDKILDEKLFEISYKYRLENIAYNKIIMMSKICNDNEKWILIKELMNRYKINIPCGNI